MTARNCLERAGTTGDVLWLRTQLAANTLPDLHQPDEASWYLQDYAADSGQLDVLKWIISDYNTTVSASPVLLLNRTRRQPIDLTAYTYFVLRRAVAQQHFPVIQWFLEEYVQDPTKFFTSKAGQLGWKLAVDASVYAGNLKNFQYLVQEYTDRALLRLTEPTPFNFVLRAETVLSAAENNDTALLRWIHTEYREWLKLIYCRHEFDTTSPEPRFFDWILSDLGRLVENCALDAIRFCLETVAEPNMLQNLSRSCYELYADEVELKPCVDYLRHFFDLRDLLGNDFAAIFQMMNEVGTPVPARLRV